MTKEQIKKQIDQLDDNDLKYIQQVIQNLTTHTTSFSQRWKGKLCVQFTQDELNNDPRLANLVKRYQL